MQEIIGAIIDIDLGKKKLLKKIILRKNIIICEIKTTRIILIID